VKPRNKKNKTTLKKPMPIAKISPPPSLLNAISVPESNSNYNFKTDVVKIISRKSKEKPTKLKSNSKKLGPLSVR
jgi:hypothetical protein